MDLSLDCLAQSVPITAWAPAQEPLVRRIEVGLLLGHVRDPVGPELLLPAGSLAQLSRRYLLGFSFRQIHKNRNQKKKKLTDFFTRMQHESS